MDWNNPTLATLYSQFVDDIKARDFDALSLGKNAITNPPQFAMRFNRATNIFEEYDGAAWNTKVLGVTGGGTGVTSLAALKAGFGFGTLADQNANNVSISGGNISGLATFSISGKVQTSSNLTDSIKTAGGIECAGVAIINTAGKIPAISATYFANLSGANLTGVVAANSALLEGHNAAYFALVGHNHNGVYSGISHNHDGVYQPLGGAAISIDSNTNVSLSEGSNQDYPVVLGGVGTRIYQRTNLFDGTYQVCVQADYRWNGSNLEDYSTYATITVEHGLVKSV